MNYRQATEYVNSLAKFGIVPGLDSIRELCRRMGNPQDGLKFVHIAGTNGKGSTVAYISTILQYAGYKTGRYVSPAVFEYRERFQVNGKMISQAAFCRGIEQIRGICEKMTQEGFHHPTPFEVETALAFWYFREKECDIVVMETGMGGLLDATNLVTTTVTAVITPISKDHMAFLGKSLQEIAGQKAGIIKAGVPVVTIRQDEEVMEVLQRKADEMGSHLVITDPGKVRNVKYGLHRQSFDYGNQKKLEIALAGQYQIENAVLVMETIPELIKSGFHIEGNAVRDGLKNTLWQGRFSIIAKKPLFIIDGAHNEDAAKKLAQSIGFYFTNKRIIYIMGVLRDKEYDKIISLTKGYADHIITVTSPDNPRAFPAYELAQEIIRIQVPSEKTDGLPQGGKNPDVTAVDSLEEAVEMSRLLAGSEDVIIAFGSLSYLGRLAAIVRNPH